MKKSVCRVLAAIGLLFALLALSAPTPTLAQNTNYPGMCTGYSAPGECERCCARLAKGNSECTNACRAGRPASDAKAMMTPKRK